MTIPAIPAISEQCQCRSQPESHWGARSYLRITALNLLVARDSPLTTFLATRTATLVFILFHRWESGGAGPICAYPKWRSVFRRVSYSGHSAYARSKKCQRMRDDVLRREKRLRKSKRLYDHLSRVCQLWGQRGDWY